MPGIPCLSYSAPVLCATAGCDHRNCHDGPFHVLIVGLDDQQGPVHACSYSSEARAWGTPVSVPLHADMYSFFSTKCGALIGDELYYCILDNRIVEYDLGKNCLSLIDVPDPNDYGLCSSISMLMEDGSLGFACTRDSNLYLWSRKVKPTDGVVVWVPRKVIELELEKLVPTRSKKKGKLLPTLIGAAQGVDVVFMNTSVGIFMYEFKSGKARMVEEEPTSQYRELVATFMSFYTPDYTINKKGRPWQQRHIIDQDEVPAEHFISQKKI